MRLLQAITRLQGRLVLASMLLSISACQTPKTIPIERVRSDTVMLTNIVFDSTNVSRDYRERDTAIVLPSGERKEGIVIREQTTEYRYRMLRDTIRQVTRDSIPYEVRVTEYKQVRSPPTWFDKLCRTFFIAAIVFYIIKFRKGG